MLSSEQLGALAAATRHGAPVLELTSRGNVQLRSVTDADAVTALLVDAGLLPTATHDRVRNIVASPLSGRTGAFPDVRPMVGELHDRLIADPALARLTGRFLFSMDDGRGDMTALVADIGLRPVDDAWTVSFAGARTSLCPESAYDAIGQALAAAVTFTEIRGSAWRVSELPGGADALAAAVGATVIEPAAAPRSTLAPVGWIEQNDGLVTLGAAVPLGRLAADTAALLAAAEKPVVITPWRSLLLCDLAPEDADAVLRVLAPRGLVFDENSPWLTNSACTGRPGCARSLADVHADVRLDVAEEIASRIHTPVHRHWVGCERACGSPTFGQVLVATESGYRPTERHEG